MSTLQANYVNKIKALLKAGDAEKGKADQIGSKMAKLGASREQHFKMAQDRFLAAGKLLVEWRDAEAKNGNKLSRHAMGKLCGIGVSRLGELLSIGSGRRTAEGVAAATTRRVKKHQAKLKHKAATADVLNAKIIPLPNPKKALAKPETFFKTFMSFAANGIDVADQCGGMIRDVIPELNPTDWNQMVRVSNRVGHRWLSLGKRLEGLTKLANRQMAQVADQRSAA